MFDGARRHGSIRSGALPDRGCRPRQPRGFARGDEAASALENAILVGVIAVALAAALVPFSGDLQAAIVDLFARIPVLTAGVGT